MKLIGFWLYWPQTAGGPWMQHRPHFTLRRLEVFAAIADCGSFRAAADKLGMTQPSVSTHIEALESQLNGELFRRRRGRSSELTDLGTTFLKHARRVLTDAETMASDLAHTREERARRVVFACQRSLSDLIPSMLAEFARRHAEIELVTRVGRQEEVIDLVRSSAADMGLCLGNDGIGGLDSIEVGEQQFVVIASCDHPLAGRPAVAPEELSRHNFVGAPENSLLGSAISRMLAGIGATPLRVVSRATEFAFLRALVLEGVGLYCCLASHVRGDIAAGRLVALSIKAPALTLPMAQVFPAARKLSRAVYDFAAFQRQRLAQIGRGLSL
jgi:DNA-binding transcriptional LysR family regulator